MNELVKYSLIVPVFCNEGMLKKTAQELYEHVIKQNPGGEMIFVDDGSFDQSLGELLEIKHKFPCMYVIKFTRNFGQIAAFLAGCAYAKGECVIHISADLQDPPELINDMLKYYFEEQYESVICFRESREDAWFRKKTSQLFYSLMRILSFPSMPIGGFDYFLISKKIKDMLLFNQEHNMFLQGQILWTGFKTKFIPYHRRRREVGKSQWRLSKRLKMMLDSVISYSYAPLRAMSLLGGITAFIGFIYAGIIVCAKLFGKVPFQGWAPLMILILVLSGIQMMMIGIVGEYLWRTLDQVRKRPLYIIEKIYETVEKQHE